EVAKVRCSGCGPDRVILQRVHQGPPQPESYQRREQSLVLLGREIRLASLDQLAVETLDLAVPLGSSPESQQLPQRLLLFRAGSHHPAAMVAQATHRSNRGRR